MQVAVDTRRPTRQDTFDLRDQIQQDDHAQLHAHADAASATYNMDDEETSVMEDDSEGEDQDEFIDDDGSSSLSIPNESIDFDLVYSLHSFAATVEGQANVVKGDSLFLMDDSNSYWWLVRVLKTQEVGYIPAENIETPFERLARLNKHRNIDLALATQAEVNEGLNTSQDLRNNLSSRAGSNRSTSPQPRDGRNVHFKGPKYALVRYPRAIWGDGEEEDSDSDWCEWSEHEDIELANELRSQGTGDDSGPSGMEPDDGMDWDDVTVQELQQQQMQQQVAQPPQVTIIPPQAGTWETQQQRQQDQASQRQREIAAAQAQQQQQLQTQQQQHPVAQAQQTLRTSTSRERMQVDPEDATETRKLTATPAVARGDDGQQPYLPSTIQQEVFREDEGATDDLKRKQRGKERAGTPVSSARSDKPTPTGKLRKERDSDDDSSNGKESKKKKGVFGFFSGRKKDKKDKGSIGSIDSADTRVSDESNRSGQKSSLTTESVMSPTTATAMQQQQQQSLHALRGSPDIKRVEQQQQQDPRTPERPPPQVSQHASQVRQRDQQQQALYQQQYLNRSPSSPPEAQPSYGLQSAPVVMNSFSGYGAANSGLGPPVSRPRPGSLILTQSVTDAGAPVPELSVIRVFAGKSLQTEATFKTVLLNSSTTSSDLVKQATQRFRLSLGDEDEKEYYLTAKQVEGGGFTVLHPDEKPLVVFEQLVSEAMEMPKVKRSSVGSISSVASNLSMHPAIKKLPMNDFTDDSAVKFYLNRKGDSLPDESVPSYTEETDETLIAVEPGSPSPRQLLMAPTSYNVTPERFTSPSFRFAVQLVIYPDDLPDDMCFHPLTEAIVFKDTLRGIDGTVSPNVSPNMRRKVFMFPKNATVAEVIELGLERFGISEGVVDGGDEIEDKSTKRRSSTRIRYGLFVDIGSSPERELAPSSRVIDAFPRPPALKTPERPNKRRSVDSALILGMVEDVGPDDPVFILRRAVSYRNSTYRHRMSAPLDELALHQLHRDSLSSASGSDPASPSLSEHKPSRQEIIARQREATRANQRAILSAQTNSVRGMDVLLPGNTMLRSSRYDVNDRMRYSYVEADGETYDISDIVEQELRDHNSANRNDLLESVLGRRDIVGEKLNRVLNKIKSEKNRERDIASVSSADSTRQSQSISEYSIDDASTERGHDTFTEPPKSKTPNLESSQTHARTSSRQGTTASNSRTTTPTGRPTPSSTDRRNPSVTSGFSEYATPPTHAVELPDSPHSRTVTPKPQQEPRRPVIPSNEFGIEHMLSIIQYKDAKPKVPLPPLHPVDALLFGRPLDLGALNPKVRDIYAPAFRQLEEMDTILDDYLGNILAGR